MYHPNSPYGKIEATINSDRCFCGNSKIRNKPFCFGCVDDLKEQRFNVSRVYRSGENGLEGILDALNELGLRLKD